ncbi:MAG: motility protein A [candidate division Zixibacteria bacterium]|nr:motility protein A [candidate division Zixibacteria bacterium]
MDIATFGGLILGIGAIGVAYFLEGGQFSAVFQVPAMILVIFGTIGAATITTSLKTLLNVPKVLKIAFSYKEHNSVETIRSIVSMAEKARRDGILGLENNLKVIRNPFLKKAVQLVVDGTEVTVLRNILENEIDNISDRHKSGILLFQKLGGFSPTLGIIGTVLALIHALSNTDQPGRMAASVATAFIATLWGVALANLVYLPICDKLRRRHEDEVSSLNLIMEGIVSIQSGDNPRVIKTNLMSFVHPNLRSE